MNAREFEAQVGPLRAELRAHCYRMLGSLQDAEDALQEALLGAWRGIDGFEARSTLRSWLYRIATNACLRALENRPKRILPLDHGAPASSSDLDPVLGEVPWLEPFPNPVGARFEELESLELSFVAALQHLPANQRAVLLMREVLDFSAAETAELLSTSVPSVNSALQRAHATVESRVPERSQQVTLRELPEASQQALVRAYVSAWAERDVNGLVRLLAADVRFSMPPIPTWFDGREAVARFFEERIFAQAWRLEAMRANGQWAFACYMGPDFRLGALNVIRLDPAGKIAELTGFLQPEVHAFFSLPER